MLGLDASTAAAGDELTGMGSDPADAAWPATEDPAMSLRLFNAGEWWGRGGLGEGVEEGVTQTERRLPTTSTRASATPDCKLSRPPASPYLH